MSKIISIIVPVVNEPTSLFRKVINQNLNQTHRDIELIIVDDGVTNKTILDIIGEASKDPRVKVFKRERETEFRTCSEAYDLGLDNVEGDWMFLAAADDYPDLDWAERLMKFVEGRESELLGVCTNWTKHHFDGKEEIVDMKVNWDWRKPSLENFLARESLGSFIFNWEKVKDLRHDARFPRSHTREYISRVLQRGDIVHLPKFLWHFNEWRSDQWTKYASIRWRILCDLKNNYADVSNLAWAINLSQGEDKKLYYSALSAYREFMIDPQWKDDFDKSDFKKQFDRVEKICFDEAKKK